MTFLEITDLLNNQFSSDFQTNTQNPQPYLTIPANQLTNVCQFLRDDDRLFFDLLACVTGIDNGVEANTMEVIYNLTSIPYAHDLMLKVIVPRNTHSSKLPSVPSVSHIWRTADWHERETFDLVVFSSKTTLIFVGFSCQPIGKAIRYALIMRSRSSITVSKPSKYQRFFRSLLTV